VRKKRKKERRKKKEELVSWSLTSLFSTNMAISETRKKRRNHRAKV